MNKLSIVHIHAPKATAKRLIKDNCHDCKKLTWFAEFFTPWYGWDSTCLRCGREYQDGCWMELPFARGNHRKKNKELAKQIWRNMPPVSENHFGLD